MSVDAFATMADDILTSAREDAQKLHDLVRTVKAAKGTAQDIRDYIANTTDEGFVARRDKIAAAKAKIAEMEAELEEDVRAEIVDPNVDVEAASKDFKNLRNDVVQTISAARIILKKAGWSAEDLAELDELQNSLPSKISGLSTGGGRSPEESKRIREWGALNGFTVNARGALPADLVAAFHAANGGAAAKSETE